MSYDIKKEIKNAVRTTTSHFIDGKATTTVIAKGEHSDMKLISGFVQLIEVPDAGGTTYTVKVTNGSDDLTNTLTFTEGSEAIADVKAFTPVSGKYGLRTQDIKIVTAGTTTTAGECIVTLEWEAIG